jgi:hypothetical protein
MAFSYADESAWGFSWVLDEPATRTSHALMADGRVWLVDPLDWPDALDRASRLGEISGVLQLLDRHNRDCKALAERLEIPQLRVPDVVPESPFEIVEVRRSRWWNEVALWWPMQHVLVVAEALGTNAFYTGEKAPLGVHLLMRLRPPRALGGFEPEHLLVGHGPGIHGRETADAVRTALRTSRRSLPGMLAMVPGFAADARRRRR